jgi:GTP-binding protein
MEVVDEVFDLFVALHASDAQLDFPYLFAIAREGIARKTLDDASSDLTPLFDLILAHVPEAGNDTKAAFKMQPSSLAYDNFLGRLAIGRVYSGIVKFGNQVFVKKEDGSSRNGKITKIFVAQGLRRSEVPEAVAGDIVTVAGIPDIYVGETITTDEKAEPLPALRIDPPTISMLFLVNDSPFAGKEGTLVTTRHIRARLEREGETNVGLKVEEMPSGDGYKVSGRGELHLSVLIEDMRREGFELQLSRPEVIERTGANGREEPMEQAIIDVPEESTGTVIDMLARRKGEMGTVAWNLKSQRAGSWAFAVISLSKHAARAFSRTRSSATKHGKGICQGAVAVRLFRSSMEKRRRTISGKSKSGGSSL